MSTACEAIAANHMGMKICGISCIANPAAGISKKPLTHKEVQQSADRAAINREPVPAAPNPSGKVCAACGTPLEDDAAFCTNCGTPVKNN